MISLDNLTVSYGGWTLFDNISFLINEKDRIGLVGKNGAGKTTLLRIITGEQQPTEGCVTINWLSIFFCQFQFLMNLFITVNYAWEIHHFSQCHNLIFFKQIFYI